MLMNARKLINPHFEIYCAALVGALAAAMADSVLEQKHSVSRFFFNFLDWVFVNTLNMHAISGIGTFVLLGLGACSVVYFRPLNLKGAFAGGFAAVAVAAILLP